MTRTALPILPLALLVACTGNNTPEPTTEASTAPPRPLVKLDELEGTWERDDGRRYQLVVANDRLIGWQVEDEQPFACRITLELQGEQLGGSATFSRRADEGALLSTTWDLKVVGDDLLMGRVEGVDVDIDADDQEVSRTWEMHDLRRVARLGTVQLEEARKLAAAHIALDAALVKGDPDSMMAVLSSPEVAALETTPGNESVGARLIAIAVRLSPEGAEGLSLEAGAPREEGEPAPPEPELTEEPMGDEEPAGDEPVATPEEPTPAAEEPEPTGGEPDMAGFLAKFDGTCTGVTAACDAYCKKDMDRQNMDWFDLREPEITKHEQKDGLDHFTLRCKAGMTIRTYVLVWKGARIVQIVDGGME